MPRIRWLAPFALTVGLAGGCGSVEYLNQVSGRAAAALEQARREGAEKHAPYEFTAATEYFRKAREEGTHAAYQTALSYASRSVELAQRAEAIARERGAASGSRAPGP